MQTRNLSHREKIELEWTRIAAESRAGPISFINEIDDEETPEICADFVYTEMEYI